MNNARAISIGKKVATLLMGEKIEDSPLSNEVIEGSLLNCSIEYSIQADSHKIRTNYFSDHFLECVIPENFRMRNISSTIILLEKL